MRTRTVVLLAFGGAQLLDVTGPAEVFGVADAMAGGGAYRSAIVSADGRDVAASSGLRIAVEGSLGDVAGPIDTLVVPGGPTWPRIAGDAGLLATLAEAAARSARVVGVCAGALVLAAAGLLDGRRATTHWQFIDELERFPAVSVERDPIFVEDGAVATCAGSTAAIDLALAMVEADLGAGLARSVARHLVVVMQRPGGHAQFSVRLSTQPPLRRSHLRPLLDDIAADPAGDHRLAALGRRAGFSERHLARLFARELGMTPARYVEQVRMEAARAALEGSDAPVGEVARLSGLRSAENLRRLFLRELGVTPQVYRERLLRSREGAVAG